MTNETNKEAVTERSVLDNYDISHDQVHVILPKLQELNIDVLNIVWRGPGGGNPMIAIVGTMDQLTSFVEWMCSDGSGEEPDFYLKDVKTLNDYMINRINHDMEDIIDRLGGRDEIEKEDDELLNEISSFGMAVDQIEKYIWSR